MTSFPGWVQECVGAGRDVLTGVRVRIGIAFPVIVSRHVGMVNNIILL